MSDHTTHDGPDAALRAALIATTRERHKDMTNLVTGLPADALDWRFALDAASLAGLCLHIVDVEGHVARLALREQHHWPGANGSRMQESATEQALRDEIERVDTLLLGALERCGPGGLSADVVEDLDHCAMHYGQMQLTRHLWESSHPGQGETYSHWR
jgi:hypothetical protein